MDWDRTRLNARIYGVRAKAKLRLLVQMFGLAAVLLGAWNLLLAPVIAYPTIAPYRFGTIIGGGESGAVFYLADVVLMAAGAAIAWWS